MYPGVSSTVVIIYYILVVGSVRSFDNPGTFAEGKVNLSDRLLHQPKSTYPPSTAYKRVNDISKEREPFPCALPLSNVFRFLNQAKLKMMSEPKQYGELTANRPLAKTKQISKRSSPHISPTSTALDLNVTSRMVNVHLNPVQVGPVTCPGGDCQGGKPDSAPSFRTHVRNAHITPSKVPAKLLATKTVPGNTTPANGGIIIKAEWPAVYLSTIVFMLVAALITEPRAILLCNFR